MFFDGSIVMAFIAVVIALAWFFRIFDAKHSATIWCLTLLGAGCNALASYSNGGLMPVLVNARDGIEISSVYDGEHQLLNKNTRLQLLCDISYLRSPWVRDSQPTYFSIGDVLIRLAGVIALLEIILSTRRVWGKPKPT